MYKGRADWTLISDVKNNPRMKIPVFGNGDVDSPEAALEMKNKFGLDGAMIGRASIGNPWIFNQIKHYFKCGEKLDEPKIIDKINSAKQRNYMITLLIMIRTVRRMMSHEEIISTGNRIFVSLD